MLFFLEDKTEVTGLGNACMQTVVFLKYKGFALLLG